MSPASLRLPALLAAFAATVAAADLSSAFGNPTLPATSGVHYVAAVGTKVFDLLSMDATGFYTTQDGLAMRSEAAQPIAGARSVRPSVMSTAQVTNTKADASLWFCLASQ